MCTKEGEGWEGEEDTQWVGVRDSRMEPSSELEEERAEEIGERKGSLVLGCWHFPGTVRK